MRADEESIEAAARYICLELHPMQLRPQYAADSKYRYLADIVTAALQALSTGMTALFVGLLTNFLYDRSKEKRAAADKQQVLDLLEAQEKKIHELELLLRNNRIRDAMTALAMHKEIVSKIRQRDASIETLLTHAIDQLERHGRDELFRRVSAYLPPVDADYEDVRDPSERKSDKDG